MRFDQTSDHKHGMHLYGMLSTKLLAQAAHRNNKFIFTETGLFLFFLKYDLVIDCPEKFPTNTCEVSVEQVIMLGT